ncbi:MAG: pyruvate kinase [Fibrobacteria bacterium]|nr:pyruvate kinase [Fibrobacteria bacterium]
MELRRTKILATIGPASDSPEMLRQLFQTGVTACRLNFSHGTHGDHAARIAKIRQVADEMGIAVPIVMDLCGPKVRTDTKTYDLVVGDTWRLVPIEGDPSQGKIGISHPTLAKLVPPGQPIVLDDGHLELVVTAIEGDDIVCKVVTGGHLKSRKSVNTPDCDNGLDVLSEKDKKDLIFGRDQGLDWVAVSFVRHGADIQSVREHLASIGWPDPPIIAKIETPLAVQALDDIVRLSDGIMVARGDLGIECPIESVPILQKRAVRLAHRAAKLCVVATQMLDSMERNPRPTRAEASDVANAVFEGAQVVMLSGETAGGQHPLAAVQTMDRILRGAEAVTDTPPTLPEISNQTMEIVAGSVRLSEHTKAPCIAIFCHTMEIARQIAGFHCGAHVIAACFDEQIYRQVSLFYGIIPFRLPRTNSIDEAITRVLDEIQERNLGAAGDRIVFMYSQPFGTRLHNTIRLVQMP